MAETLYRKYRPQTFADVAEQHHVIRTITNQLANGSIAHAYLFAGPRGVGKTTIARLLAKAVNCTGRAVGQSEPCNMCAPCREFSEGRYIDTVEMDAASNTGVDNVRDNVIENIRFVPQQGKYKVFIIDEVHMLSTSAFNALLKTLEEPPQHALFILATTELHKIPATIISRCQRFDFHRIPAPEMMTRLRTIAEKEGVQVDDDVLASIARLSEGCLRDGEVLLGQVLTVGGEHVTLDAASVVLPRTNVKLISELIDALTNDDLPMVMRSLGTFVDEGGSIRHLTDEMIEYVRVMLFALLGRTEEAYDKKTMEMLAAATTRMQAADARRLLDLVLTARNRTSISLLPQLPLELALAEFGLGSSQWPVASNQSPVVGGQSKPAPVASTPTAPAVSESAKPPAVPSAQIGGGPIPRMASSSIIAPRAVAPAVAESRPLDHLTTRPLEAAVMSGTVKFTVEELQDKWTRCCEYVADRNGALPLVLQAIRPYSVEGNVVTLSSQFEFHASTVEEPKNKRLIEAAIAAVMMEPVFLKSRVDVAPADESVTNLAQAFGGSIVG